MYKIFLINLYIMKLIIWKLKIVKYAAYKIYNGKN